MDMRIPERSSCAFEALEPRFLLSQGPTPTLGTLGTAEPQGTNAIALETYDAGDTYWAGGQLPGTVSNARACARNHSYQKQQPSQRVTLLGCQTTSISQYSTRRGGVNPPSARKTRKPGENA